MIGKCRIGRNEHPAKTPVVVLDGMQTCDQPQKLADERLNFGGRLSFIGKVLSELLGGDWATNAPFNEMSLLRDGEPIANAKSNAIPFLALERKYDLSRATRWW